MSLFVAAQNSAFPVVLLVREIAQSLYQIGTKMRGFAHSENMKGDAKLRK